MKISNKIIEDVVIQIAGEDVIPLVNELKNKKNVSEFKLAEKLKEEINITRNMLYRLYHANLVSFTRKKDKQKGWYIYYWTFKNKQIKFLALELKKQRLEKMKERLSRESDGQFYMCATKCMRLNFDQAMDFNYKCPECGSLMEEHDNSKTKANLNEEIKKLEKELAPKTTKKKTTKKKAVKKKK